VQADKPSPSRLGVGNEAKPTAPSSTNTFWTASVWKWTFRLRAAPKVTAKMLGFDLILAGELARCFAVVFRLALEYPTYR